MNDNAPYGKLFHLFNHSFLLLSGLLCLLPFVHVLAQSLSSAVSIAANEVTFWPVDYTAASYELIFKESKLLTAMGISVQRVVLGVAVNMLLTVLIAYPLSKEDRIFKGRTVYAWMLVFAMIFSGGLIPLYLTVNELGLMDSIWSLILPGAVPIYNVVLMLNFFRSLPKELAESSYIDGAGHWGTLFRIYVPLSLPAMATLTLFSIVGHWNSWFDGIIFMNNPIHYPLSSYLQTVIIPIDVTAINSLEDLHLVSDRSLKDAQIIVGALPVLVIYPFLQRFFVKGIVLGAVKE
ncbi:carbohydrate ABC transporter permease [Paenibacillus sp. J5C_2022]|uniref:carbohydrate ABC transporter permease n=1 Tax=Paenibacillus sp. J5C2022 TaxID=2977129 RepID=UPI0021D06A2E|nr:carbohydrate ABC transporter permease [Paenibacillus sp. J5C2022]MCU6712297.1 carbohydrate ABC transporter permease [Paenibacillus sp. J5C2022]